MGYDVVELLLGRLGTSEGRTMTENSKPFLRVVEPDEDMTPVLTESVARELTRKLADLERRLLFLEGRHTQLVKGLTLLRWKAAPITGHDIDVLLERLES